jgi:SAM-dependent methyltransferase
MTAPFSVAAFWNAMDLVYTPRPRNCLACDGAGPFTHRTDHCRFGGGRLDRLECPDCGCVFGPLKFLDMPPEVIDADYAQLYADYSEEDSTEYERRAFFAMRPEKGKVYLNWGCGAWNTTIRDLRAEGWDVWGYEPHVPTGDPFVVPLREGLSGHRFDGIFSSNVIEHLLDPYAQFMDWRSLLKPKGVMAHATACYDWRYTDSRFHVFFPLGSAMQRLGERTGFALTGSEDDGEFRVRVLKLGALAKREPGPRAVREDLRALPYETLRMRAETAASAVRRGDASRRQEMEDLHAALKAQGGIPRAM